MCEYVWQYTTNTISGLQTKNEDSVRNMYIYKNIWNGIGKGKYKLSLQVWVGMWVRKR